MFLLEGSFGNGGAMRIAPVGLVYRNASLHSLQEAVSAALLCTHVHPIAVEGALTQALAVAELSKCCVPADPAASRGAAGGGGRLLRVLQQQLSGSQHGMLDKLAVLEQALQEV
jgi:poly(ADP-ribose) glycohydrolase ARH3